MKIFFLILFFIFLPSIAFSQSKINTSGQNSPAFINSGSGNTYINYGVSEETLRENYKVIDILLKEKNLSPSDIIYIGSVLSKLKEKLEIKDDNIELKTKAEVCIDKGQLDCAERYLNRILEQNIGKISENLIMLAHVEELKMDFKKAEEFYERALAIDPYNLNILLDFGTLLEDPNKDIYNPEKSRIILEIALAKSKELSKINNNYNYLPIVGRILINLSSVAETELIAEKNLKEASDIYEILSKDGKNEFKEEKLQIYINLGLTYLNLCKIDESKKAFEDGIKIINMKNPGIYSRIYAVLFYNYALLLQKNGNLKDAFENNSNAITLLSNDENNKSTFGLILSLQGVIFAQLNDLDEAENYFNDALKILINYNNLNEQLVPIYLNLGTIYRSRNLTKEAFIEFEKAFKESLEIEKKSRFNKENLAKAFSALSIEFQAYGRLRDIEKSFIEGIKLYGEILEEDPSKYAVPLLGLLNDLGVLYAKHNSFNKAEKCFIDGLQIGYEIEPEKNSGILSIIEKNLNALYEQQNHFQLHN